MNHIFSDKLVVLKRPGFQSRKRGVPNFTDSRLFHKKPLSLVEW